MERVRANGTSRLRYSTVPFVVAAADGLLDGGSLRDLATLHDKRNGAGGDRRARR